jgi:acyl carrier protein
MSSNSRGAIASTAKEGIAMKKLDQQPTASPALGSPAFLGSSAFEPRRRPEVSIRSEVTALFEQVANEQGLKLAALSDGLALLDTGLDSLSFAIIVVRLEESLGVDPFSAAQGARFPATVGDFIQFYEDARR